MRTTRIHPTYFPFSNHFCRVQHYSRRSLLRATLIFFSLIGLHIGQARAQFLGGFFSQQSSKEKLMAEQVVGIQTYLGALKGGYQIANNGLNTVHELKGGTFGLHTAYFHSLEQVSPVVQQNPKGKAIAELYQQLCNQFNTEIAWQKKQQQFSAAEMAYLQKVSDNLQKVATEDMASTTDGLTPGKLQLTDPQRLDRLDKLYDLMKDKAAFASSFTSKCRQLAISRQRAKADKERLKKLYGIQ
jgi:hypothetical protein